MAGTGHPYEIANLSRLLEAVDEAAERVPEGDARRWFRSRHVLRFLTSEPYVARVPSDCSWALDSFDPEERERLAAKAAAGGDVRLFSRDMQSAIGPDLGHVADWISWIARHDPRTCAKLPRITLRQAADRADGWMLSRMSRDSGGKGRTESVLTTAAGRTWHDLLDPEALVAEGNAMGHCVGAYDDRLLSGTARILSLRDQRGRSLVTAEFAFQGGMSLRQAYGAGNTPVPSHAQRCLAELMDHLGATGAAAAEAAGVCRGGSGKWVPLYEAWERTQWNGWLAAASDRTMLVMSPRNPAVPLARVVFSGPGRVAGVAIPAESRHFHIDELRSAARIRNILGQNLRHSAEWPGLSWHEGRWAASRDLWERREAGGVTCLVEKGWHGEIVHVCKSDDEARTLLMVGDARNFKGEGRTSSYGYLTGYPCDQIRWSVPEARRCMSVLTAMGVRLIETQHEDGRAVRNRHRPVVSREGQWSLFMHDSETASALTLPGEWRFSDRLAELSAKEGTVSVTHADGVVHGVDSWFLKEATARETAAFLEARGWTADARVCGNGARMGRAGDAWIAFFRGRWLAVTSPEDFVAQALALVPRRRAFRLSRAEAEAVFRSLPEESLSGEADRLLAAAVSSWARKAPKERSAAVMLDPSGMLDVIPSSDRIWSDSWEGRLRVAARLEQSLSAADSRALGRVAAVALRHAVSGRKMRSFDHRRPAAAHILAEHVTRLPEALAARAIKRVIGDGLDIPILKGAKAPHPAWFGPVLSLAKAHGIGYAIERSADLTLHRIGKAEDLDLADAGAWLECFRLASRHRFHFGATRQIQGFAEHLAARAAASADAERASWELLAREAAALKDSVGTDAYGEALEAA